MPRAGPPPHPVTPPDPFTHTPTPPTPSHPPPPAAPVLVNQFSDKNPRFVGPKTVLAFYGVDGQSAL
jgi:hypothetical protein